MTVHVPSSDVQPCRYETEANELINGLVREPWGRVSPSAYETARLVAVAPWLTGHASRVAYLLANQRTDGGWGGPGGYALVPTLSAADAVLSALVRRPDGVAPAVLARSADRALGMLARLIPGLDANDVPDTPAVDMITASLVGSIGARLRVLRDAPSTDVGRVADWTPPPLPAGIDRRRLDAMLAALDAGLPLQMKLFHALEVAGPAASGAAGAAPAPTGAIGAAPAATAAWLGERGPADPGHPARRFLEAVGQRHRGPVPCGIPITVFERSWVISSLLRAGLSPAVPAGLAAELAAAVGPHGSPAAAGLPADADTTAVALYTLSLLGVKRTPDALWRYETETHFCTWPGEDGHSTSVNAHILDAFGQYLRDVSREASTANPRTVHRAATSVRKISSWLCDRQHMDGSWRDRWHASPYYATACCALALSDFGGGGAREAVARAVRWVLATQRPDGSWGAWSGTAEETAYAIQTLSLAGAPSDDATERALTNGRRSLISSAEAARHPALWHDKDLYLPTAVVEAGILAALYLADRRLSTGTGDSVRPGTA
ncbi:prenyltransferase/squalene oxidase repeat-containing protein [Actinomadura sp. 1N219]|uniref:prenyltransferase/squalene oxidase repeat-containing protein n=1 Tax=Actinomadura sp. 1N219 TaxID=3375152 RepID=UPI0037953B19